MPAGQDPEPTGYVVGYARVSTEDQNLRLQYDALTKYGVPEPQIYSDQASGTDAARPGLIAAMKDLRPGDTLVVWKLDRLGRDLSQLLRTAERLREKGVRLVVLTEAIDTTTIMGRFMYAVMGAFAQMEREMIQERTMAGLKAARARGVVGGRRPTYSQEQYEEADRLTRSAKEGGEGLSPKDAAERVGIGRSMFYKWRKQKAEERDAAAIC